MMNNRKAMEPFILLSSFITFFYALSMLITPTSSKRSHCSVEPNSSWPIERINTTQKLIWLRNEMNRASSTRSPTLDAFIVSSYDEHQGEFLAERDKKLQYISGFSGPFGVAVITKAKAAFWTNSENCELADRQLDCNWILMCMEQPKEPSVTDWLKLQLKPGYRVGADPKSISFGVWEAWNRDLGSGRIALIETHNDLIDVTWTIGRPSYGGHSVFILPPKYAGVTWQSKIQKLRENLEGLGCDAMIVTALEEVAWLLNVRGRDVPFNPFVRSYLIVTKADIHWYVPLEKVGDTVRKQLMIDTFGEFSIRTHAYPLFLSSVRTLSQIWEKVLIPSSCAFSPGASQAIFSAVPPDKRFLWPSPVIFMKAKKNRIELEGMRKANLRDSAALVDFLSILEEQIRNGSIVTETSIARSLERHRLNENMNQGIPFPTVAAFSKNGALLRYQPSSATDTRVDATSLLVLHGGGHYYDGTSDVTRTFHFGTPTKRMINDYTRLLSGLIRLSTATFPSIIKSTELDVMLRSKLWEYGVNYRHDTCHGIGSFSSAKESPTLINYNSIQKNERQLEEGYFLTCEPGFYKSEEYGIKLGNVVEVIIKFPVFNDTKTTYLGFEQVSLIPFEPKLIDFEKLSEQEIEWLNNYNQRIATEIGAELQKQSKPVAFRWLTKQTKLFRNYHCNSSAISNTALIFSVMAIIFNYLACNISLKESN